MCETSEPATTPLNEIKLDNIRAEIASRILEAFDYRSEREIAGFLGISCREAEVLLSGRKMPSVDALLQVHAATKASLHWILTGDGGRSQTVVRPVWATEEWSGIGLS